MKRCSFSAVVLCLLVSSFAFGAGGDMGLSTDPNTNGTQAHPYLIEDLADFNVFTGNPNYWDDHTRLDCDLNLSAAGTYTKAPIAHDPDSGSAFDGTGFSGTFDGNAHIIRNLTVDGAYYCGLFGNLTTGSEVKNLGMEDVSIIGSVYYVGGLAGWNDGSITNSYSTGTVNGTSRVGGLVGYNPFGIITSSYSTCQVNGRTSVGGLVGHNRGGTITASYSTASVNGISTTGFAIGGLVGVNQSSGIVEQCYYAGYITVSEGAVLIGGLVGHLDGILIDSFWDMEISQIDICDGGVGLTTSQMQDMTTYSLSGWAGMVWTMQDGFDYPHLAWENTGAPHIADPIIALDGSGTPEEPYLIQTAGQLKDLCFSSILWDKHMVLTNNIDMTDYLIYPIGVYGKPFTGGFNGSEYTISNLEMGFDGANYVGLFGYIDGCGLVTHLNLTQMIITGESSVGGLAAVNNGTISHCSASGQVKAFRVAGGLIGENESEGVISNCFTNGSVTGTTTGPHSCVFFGGLTGDNNGFISNCHSNMQINGRYDLGGLIGRSRGPGIVLQCYSSGSVIGTGDHIGGLIGHADNVLDRHVHSIGQSYSIGEVSGSDRIGGLVGDNEFGSNISNCYSVGQVTGDNSVGGLIGRNDNGNISNSYFLDTAGPHNGLGLPLDDPNMMIEANYDQWDFDITWWINDGRDYPKLGWQPFGDLNNDSHVNVFDLGVMSAAWGASDGDANYNSVCELSGDNTIDAADLFELAGMWMAGPF